MISHEQAKQNIVDRAEERKQLLMCVICEVIGDYDIEDYKLRELRDRIIEL